jgi:hypothetical protein
MSRSRKKNSFVKCNGRHTEKDDKRIAHKAFRQAERQAIHHEETPPEKIKEITNQRWIDTFYKLYVSEEDEYYPPLDESKEEQQKDHDKWREKVMRK